MPTESFSLNISPISSSSSSSSNTVSGLEELSPVNMKVVYCVLLDMALSFFGILCNLLVVTTIRHHEEMQNSTTNLLLINLCFSNLLISFLVKPISAIYVSYALSTKEWHVGLAFCTLYTLTYRTTWLAFPFSLGSLCWNSLDTHCKKITCCRSYHHQHGTVGNIWSIRHDLGMF